jgi:hypothetical protein
LKAGKFDLNNPATTLAHLKPKAVVGLVGFFNARGGLRSIDLQCGSVGALESATVGLTLNVGAILSLALDPRVRSRKCSALTAEDKASALDLSTRHFLRRWFATRNALPILRSAVPSTRTGRSALFNLTSPCLDR